MGSLTGKNILVSSGGTREYIDDVRVVTNISTGALGSKIAEELYHRGAKVHYVYGVGAHMPNLDVGMSEGTFNSYPIKSCADLHDTMKALIPAFKMNAVIHSAAVSDYTFRRDIPVKLSSSDAEGFIEYMRKTITPNIKIIQKIKEWLPETTLIGFKFTVGETKESLIEIAKTFGVKSKCDAVFANDKQMMIENKNHIGFFVDLKKSNIKQSMNKSEIAKDIADYLESL